MQDIADIMKSLFLQQWEWNNEAVRTILKILGWALIRTVLHRDEYRLPNGWIASVYNDEEGAPCIIEVDVDVFDDVNSLDSSQYEDKDDEYFTKYQTAVETARTVLGDPVFDDGAAAVGFPEDQDAVWLAMWKSQNARCMIQQKHEDRELPFRICIIVAPHES